MSSASKILLILGSGGRVGASVASQFSKYGYSVAIAARSLEDGEVNEAGHLQLKTDLADPEQVRPAFEKTRAKFGGWPSAVVYNAAVAHFVPADDPLTADKLTADIVQSDFMVNTTSVLVAAQQALAVGTKTFIYTGNFLNFEVMPALLTNGVGKAATAHLMRIAHEAYSGKGHRFYYADERVTSGFAAFRDVNGPAHGEHYFTLAESEDALPWLQTFVAGKGYVDFKGETGPKM